MLTALTITGFRGFPKLNVAGLSRINLFVGRNNAGKTSLLEAVEILAAGGHPSVLFRSPRRRAEQLLRESAAADRNALDLDLRHLFNGRGLTAGARFRIESQNAAVRFAECEIVPATELGDAGAMPLFPDSLESGPMQALRFTGSQAREGVVIALNSAGSVQLDALRRLVAPALPSSPVLYLGTEGVDAAQLGAMWDGVVLTPSEEEVMSALRIIEPDIERLAITGRDGSRETGRSAGGGAFVSMKGQKDRIPLGSMGDGIRRLLVMSLHVSRAAGGVLLVDDFDTGLHHSVIEKLWVLLITMARRLDVQVFATSHSSDCLRALGQLQASRPDLAREACVHRIERGMDSTIRYGADEIMIAAEHDIEVRG